MADKKLIDEVGKYIDKYYEPVKDDIKMDKEMKSIFDKITKFRKKRAEEKALQEEPVKESSLSEEALPEEFDVSTMQKTKIQKGIQRLVRYLAMMMSVLYHSRLLQIFSRWQEQDRTMFMVAVLRRKCLCQ